MNRWYKINSKDLLKTKLSYISLFAFFLFFIQLRVFWHDLISLRHMQPSFVEHTMQLVPCFCSVLLAFKSIWLWNFASWNYFIWKRIVGFPEVGVSLNHSFLIWVIESHAHSVVVFKIHVIFSVKVHPNVALHEQKLSKSWQKGHSSKQPHNLSHDVDEGLESENSHVVNFGWKSGLELHAEVFAALAVIRRRVHQGSLVDNRPSLRKPVIDSIATVIQAVYFVKVIRWRKFDRYDVGVWTSKRSWNIRVVIV